MFPRLPPLLVAWIILTFSLSASAQTDLNASPGLTSVQEMTRLEGQGESILRGLGIVFGLKGTGDSGADLAAARMVAKFYENSGNPLPDLRELAKAKSFALVALEVVVPPEGARKDDKLDVFVATTHAASSVVGGRLYISPMLGPLPGQGVYAFASGPLVIEDTAIPTVGRIRGGARVVEDILMPGVRDRFNLIVHPHFRSWTVTDQLADTINALAPEADAGDEEAAQAQIASAIDDATVQVNIPVSERANPAKFLSRVLSATFSPSLLRLPAQVIVNPRTGSIVVTGNVEISSVVIVHKDLVITTTTPPPQPSPVNPITRTDRAAIIGTTSRGSERARIQDLLQALRQLDVPAADQIAILQQIHQTGRLHARLITE